MIKESFYPNNQQPVKLHVVSQFLQYNEKKNPTTKCTNNWI